MGAAWVDVRRVWAREGERGVRLGLGMCAPRGATRGLLPWHLFLNLRRPFFFFFFLPDAGCRGFCEPGFLGLFVWWAGGDDSGL